LLPFPFSPFPFPFIPPFFPPFSPPTSPTCPLSYPFLLHSFPFSVRQHRSAQ
jgi:hypothetical protein